jgi:hypothetical protein
MNDMTGREIKVGDKLVYTSDAYGPKLTIGYVMHVGEKTAVIKRWTTASYEPIMDGVMMRNVWNAEKKVYEPTTCTPRQTIIGYPSRCLVIS